MMIENRVGKFLLYGIILLNIYFFVPYMYRSYVKMEKLQREQNDIKEKIELAKNKIEDYNNLKMIFKEKKLLETNFKW